MLKGIDISHHQNFPDFAKVKAAGAQFVILKATEGVNYVDPNFNQNAKAALGVGLPIGAYHFLRSGSVIDQANDFLEAIQPYKLTWPAAVDVEDAPNTTELSSMSTGALTEMVLNFCSYVKAAGYQPCVYSNYNWLFSAKHLDIIKIREANIPIWLAWYSKATPDNADRSSLCDMWQYASDGKIDGISASGLDMNVSYKNFGKTFISDTNSSLSIKHGAFYQLKVTSLDGAEPKVLAGTKDVVAILPRYNIGSDYYFYLCAVGAAGSGAGIYINGERVFVANVT
jgi:lysozyme